MAKRFVYTLIKKSDIVEGTLDAILSIFCWSMNALLTGIMPAYNHNNLPIPGGGKEFIANGFKGIFVQCRGDWEFQVLIHRFPRWDNAIRMCWMCAASSAEGILAFFNVGRDAPWRDTLFTHESFLAQMDATGGWVPIFLRLAVGFRLECIMIDVLHCVDQGVASHIIANVFWLSIRRKVFAPH